MTPELLVSYASFAALLILCVAFLLTVYRVTVGPTLPDRVVALDMLVGIAIGFIAVIAIRTASTFMSISRSHFAWSVFWRQWLLHASFCRANLKMG